MAVGVGASDPAVTGYVPLFHDLLRGELACRPSHRPGCRKLALDNLAVGGATSATLVRDQLPDAVTELEARNHDRRPNNDVKVITIDIGGNDVFAAALAGTGPQGPSDAATIPIAWRLERTWHCSAPAPLAPSPYGVHHSIRNMA